LPRESPPISTTGTRYVLLSGKWIGDCYFSYLLSVLKVFTIKNVTITFDRRSHNQ